MATTLHKIQFPSLVNSNFGTNLKEAFDNIDSNFQKLASLGLTAGESGTPAVWVPYNLNSVFCYIDASNNFKSDYLRALGTSHPHGGDYIEAINNSYNKYNEVTGFSKYRYIAECALLYDRLLQDLPDDKNSNDEAITVDSGSDENTITWKHKWENDITLKNIFPTSTSDPEVQAIFSKISSCRELKWGPNAIGVRDALKQYVDFIPGDILVAGNYDAESNKFTRLGTTAHIYIDPRFRNPLTIAGKANTIQLSEATDCSCVVYGTPYGSDDEENPVDFKFEYVYAFPRIHCDGEDFYLSVNGIDTNIPLTGRAGASGKDSQFATVQISAPASALTDIIYNGAPGTSFDVVKKIGPNSENELDDTEKQLLGGCPAFIFPPIEYTENAYVTLYWVGYLTYEEGSLKAYCGRENLIMVDLYEHSFGGMMMGLDMYEQAKARPAGNVLWTKPRGLMLPIGSRKVGDDGYWDPSYDPASPDPTHFAAHLIYSEGGDNRNQKYNLHISSVNDYRALGQLDDQDGTNHSSQIDSVSGVELFIDEPTSITGYNKAWKMWSDTDESPIIPDTRIGKSVITSERFSPSDSQFEFHNYAGLRIGSHGSNTFASRNSIKTTYLQTHGAIVEGKLVVGRDTPENDVFGDGILVNGDIIADKFTRKNQCNPGQLLLANGWSTAAMPIEVVTGSTPGATWINNSTDGDAKIKITVPDAVLTPTQAWNVGVYYGANQKDYYSFKLYKIDNVMAFLHVDITFGGTYGAYSTNDYPSWNNTSTNKQINSGAVIPDNCRPRYDMFKFVGSTNYKGDIHDDDTQMGIWYKLGTDGVLYATQSNHANRLGTKTVSLDFIYPLATTTQSAPIYVVTETEPSNGSSVSTAQTFDTQTEAVDDIHRIQEQNPVTYYVVIIPPGTEIDDSQTVNYDSSQGFSYITVTVTENNDNGGVSGDETSGSGDGTTIVHYWMIPESSLTNPSSITIRNSEWSNYDHQLNEPKSSWFEQQTPWIQILGVHTYNSEVPKETVESMPSRVALVKNSNNEWFAEFVTVNPGDTDNWHFEGETISAYSGPREELYYHYWKIKVKESNGDWVSPLDGSPLTGIDLNEIGSTGGYVLAHSYGAPPAAWSENEQYGWLQVEGVYTGTSNATIGTWPTNVSIGKNMGVWDADPNPPEAYPDWTLNASFIAGSESPHYYKYWKLDRKPNQGEPLYCQAGGHYGTDYTAFSAGYVPNSWTYDDYNGWWLVTLETAASSIHYDTLLRYGESGPNSAQIVRWSCEYREPSSIIDYKWNPTNRGVASEKDRWFYYNIKNYLEQTKLIYSTDENGHTHLNGRIIEVIRNAFMYTPMPNPKTQTIKEQCYYRWDEPFCTIHLRLKNGLTFDGEGVGYGYEEGGTRNCNRMRASMNGELWIQTIGDGATGHDLGSPGTNMHKLLILWDTAIADEKLQWTRRPSDMSTKNDWHDYCSYEDWPFDEWRANNDYSMLSIGYQDYRYTDTEPIIIHLNCPSDVTDEVNNTTTPGNG